jgi:hypothetical protein
MSPTTVTVVVSISLALLGYIVTYSNSLRLDRRKDRLMRLDKQLSDLYGPLFALIRANRRAWEAFRKDVRPGFGEDFWGTDPPPTPEEAAAWRLWIVEVLLPVNEEMREVIVHHADLLDEQAIPGFLLEVCAHADSYKPAITPLARWRLSDELHAGPLSGKGSSRLYGDCLHRSQGEAIEVVEARFHLTSLAACRPSHIEKGESVVIWR